MKIHLIAIGGSAMHNMALALKKKGYTVTGSDDEINEPSKSRLQNAGILPDQIGWFPEKISEDLDAVIVGMHARIDNPELIKAKSLGLKIFSYPEYIYEQSKNKLRIVIGGSHGKTTITSMILHVLNFYEKEFDYLVGAQLKGFDTMVKFTEDAPYMIIEGDEYLSSPIDPRPKFHLYQPNIALISGIAWDHINVFPTFEIYVEQFKKFIELVQQGGRLIYCKSDEVLNKLAVETDCKGQKSGYGIPEHIIENGITVLHFQEKKYPLQVFGHHNLMNLEGARLVCESINISADEFYTAMQSFEGASKRLELVRKTDKFNFYKDFAHSPSKLKATITAVKNQFPERELTAVMELHTFSSLNEKFLSEYNGSMKQADKAIVYFNPHTIEHKKLKAISEEQVRQCFGEHSNLKIYINSSEIIKDLKKEKWNEKNLLMMSSGNFDGINFEELAGLLNSESN
jgi:UDP-N-acetylmuramate: L-alanyl-gamma-D-glutamyl-meso-diaminopimelate ligase